MTRWHVEAFQFETDPDPRGARGQDADGRSVREHDGRQEFWTGKTWLFLPKEAVVFKVAKYSDGFYLDKIEGLPYRRKATFWYYWSRPHLDWKWMEATDEKMGDNLIKIGDLNG